MENFQGVPVFILEKKVKVEDGYQSDDIIDELVHEYYQIYSRILSKLHK